MTKKKKIFLYTAFIIAILGIGGGIYGYYEYNRKNDVLTNKKADFVLDVPTIVNDFTSNEKEANTKYLDKLILVTGEVKQVDKDDKGYYTIAVGDKESMSSVRCSIDSTFTSMASGIQPATQISIKGICTGFIADELGLGSDVILNRCVIVNK